MFYYLNGTVTVLEANLAVIDVGGVGYACHTTAYTLSQLQLGKPCKLFTYCLWANCSKSAPANTNASNAALTAMDSAWRNRLFAFPFSPFMAFPLYMRSGEDAQPKGLGGGSSQ